MELAAVGFGVSQVDESSSTRRTVGFGRLVARATSLNVMADRSRPKERMTVSPRASAST